MAARVPMAPGDYVLPGHGFGGLRLVYLRTVARLVPEAMVTLQAIPPGDDAALHAWGARWRLGDAWVLEAARDHLEIWRNDPALAGRWLRVTTTPWLPKPAAVMLEPWFETEAAFVARATAAYHAAAAAAGATPTPRKRPDSGRHLVWLVRYHVGNDTLATISAREPDVPTIESVGEAVRAMATLIGLRLR